MVGIENLTNSTLNVDTLQAIGNVTGFGDFFIRVNQDIFGGWLYFILLLVLWIIMLYNAEQREKQLLSNAVASGAVVTLLSFFLRAVIMSTSGVVDGLLTDHQLWLFPIVTILLAVILWASKQN